MPKKRPKKDTLIYIALVFIFVLSSGMFAMHFINEALMAARSNRAREIVHEIMGARPSDFAGARIAVMPEPVQNEFIEMQPPTLFVNPAPFFDIDAIRQAFGNDDIVAHLYVHGTVIDYLVVQTTDNEFYQHHDIWRGRSAAGWVFLDYEVDLRGQDHNIVIYAHNTQREHMFHALRHFRSYGFFRAHPYITLITPYGMYNWQVFSFYSTFIDFSYNIINFPGEAARNEMILAFAAKSMHNSNVNVYPGDRILTLSTCTNRHPDERFVLHARLVSLIEF